MVIVGEKGNIELRKMREEEDRRKRVEMPEGRVAY